MKRQHDQSILIWTRRRHISHHTWRCISASADPADKWKCHHSAYRHQIWCWYKVFCSKRQSLPGLSAPAQSTTRAGAACSHHWVCYSTSTKKNDPVPTDDKAPQLSLSGLLIPAASSQVELYYSMSLSLSLSQHSNYVERGIKQAKAAVKLSIILAVFLSLAITTKCLNQSSHIAQFLLQCSTYLLCFRDTFLACGGGDEDIASTQSNNLWSLWWTTASFFKDQELHVLGQ